MKKLNCVCAHLVNKSLMYESDFQMCMLDYYVDISSIIETKKKMLRQYYPEDKFSGYKNN